MSAELMRALVFQHGHEIHVEETSSTRCVVVGKRRDSERETRVTWTIDDAKRAKLAQRDNWTKYPDAMLLARATAKLCRAVFPDVLAGLSYTPEELEEGAFAEEALEGGRFVDQGSEEAAAEPARPRARARRAATRGSDAPEKTEPDPVEKTPAEAPPLPGEEEDDVVDAEIVEEAEESPSEDVEEPEDAEIVDDFPDDHEGDDQQIEGSGPSYTGPQVVAIRLAELGVKDREKKLAVVNALLELEGDDRIETTKELEPGEISTVLDALKAYGPGDWIPGLELEDEDDEPAPEPEPASPPRRRATPSPEEWTVDRWRDFLKDRKVKVSEVVKEANRLGRERELESIPGTLDDVPGSGLAAELVGFVEDLAIERGDS